MFKCKDCKRQFLGGERLVSATLEREYIDGKQTLVQLSRRHGVCVKTVWNHLSRMRHKRMISKDKDVVLLLDATYWGRKFGVVFIMDAYRRKIIWHKFIYSHERVEDYMEGIRWLRVNGFRIYGIVCDGMRGLMEALKAYPVQMCQFHMIAIVKRYLTRNPDTEAAKELLVLTRTLCRRNRTEFMDDLERWYGRWKDYIHERHQDKDGKMHYVRPRLRAAYHSLKRYAPWLWTFSYYQDRVIPNTNAEIESFNGRLKTTLRVHTGLSSERRKLLIENYIAQRFQQAESP